ncbi:MAG: efflux RND transporter permease subunit [Bacteroidales bacterium]|nr:efflux RND transporter permease subunit [Candidatus Colimorpha onthohippi]
MAIYKTAINKPITTALIFVAVIVMGLFSLLQLPIDQMPEMDPPYVTVMTTYAGANASELETNVTKIIENSLNSVDGLKNITSTSKDNLSVVTLEFEWGMNLDEALNDIRSYVDLVYDNLPDGVSRPMILKLNSNMMPILQFGFTANESYSGLEKIIDDNVTNELKRIDGIGNLSVSGAPERYIYIDLNPQQLDAYGLSVEVVGNAIASNNLDLASGTIKMGKEQYQMRVKGEYDESSEIGNIVVANKGGKEIFVRDLATVRDTIKDLSLDEKINSKDGARLIISKQTGANTVAIARSVHKKMAEIKPTLPPDINVLLIRDGSVEIENAINGLAESIFYALLFVVLVVFIFLGDWRSTIIIGITIPISLVTSFIYLFLSDSSLNIISMASLTVAIGMVVDDAIVVLENVTKHVSRGESPREAAIYGTNEVWTSVIATTLVLVAVFVPLTMLPGMAGIFFKELGWIVTIVVCVSTGTAISLTPMLCSKMLKAVPFFVNKEEEAAYKAKKASKKITFDNTLGKVFSRVEAWYANVLRWCLGHKRITLLIAFSIFVISMIPMGMGAVGMDFMKEQDNGSMSITIELQRGTRIEETLKVARSIEKEIQDALGKDLLVLSTSAGSNDDAGFAALFNSTTNNKISMSVRTTKKYERYNGKSLFVMAEEVRHILSKYAEVINYQVSTASGMGAGNNLSIEVYGYDFDKTNQFTNELKHRIQKNIAGARDIKVSRDEDRAELKITFDKEKLSRHGLNGSTVATYVRYRVNGMPCGYLKEDGEEYDIVVRLQEDYRNSLSDIEEMSFMTNTGKILKLKELATIEEYWCPPTIERKNRQRYLTLAVTPYNVSLGELGASVKEELKKMSIPQDIHVALAGSYEDQQKTSSDMLMLGLLIIMLVYIVMASQFESFSKPFIIMMSIPFALTGAILALLVTGENLDMVGSLGIVLLIGIVVKNGIVLVDYINLLRERGIELREAIALSGESRLRPVMMTAFTTILGMIPMAMSKSEGSEIWVTMGIVVIGGLLISTLVTLIVVPVLYAVFERKGDQAKLEKLRKNFVFMEIDVSQHETPKTTDSEQTIEPVQ